MSDSDDMKVLTEALERLGGEHVAVDDERIEALHARVVAAVTDEGSRRGAVVALDSARTRRRSVRALALGAVAASLIALALLAGLFAADDTGVVIAAAEGVEVTLPSGDVVNGRAGLELPDGAEVDVTGFVEIDGVRYGPGSYVIVDDSIQPVVSDDGSGDFGKPGDGELDAPGRDSDAPLPTASSTTTTTVADAPSAPVESDGGDDDGGNERATSTTSSPGRDTDGSGGDRPTTTTAPAAVETRPAPVSTVSPRPSTTDAPTRTTQPPRDVPPPTRAPTTTTTTTTPRDRPTTTAATTTTVSPTTTVIERPPTRP